MRCNCLVTCSVVKDLRHGCLQLEYEVGLMKPVPLGFYVGFVLRVQPVHVNAVELQSCRKAVLNCT